MLWCYPDTQRQPVVVDTQHQANICEPLRCYGVAQHSERCATVAGACCRLSCCSGRATAGPRRAPPQAWLSAQRAEHLCACSPVFFSAHPSAHLLPCLPAPLAVGVRFLPQSNDTRLVTGAMDHSVQLHQLETAPAAMKLPLRGGGGDDSGSPQGQAGGGAAGSPARASVRSVVYACHRSRVKVSGWLERRVMSE
jgi:hypothetical protein